MTSEAPRSPRDRSSFGSGHNNLSTHLRLHENHIKVVCRVRPGNKREANLMLAPRSCITVQSTESLLLNTRPEPKMFSFDYVAGETTSQEDIFQLVGVPVTQTCLEGFNGTIICYGQTGSGKSYTTFGGSEGDRSSRGLVPRVLEYLW